MMGSFSVMVSLTLTSPRSLSVAAAAPDCKTSGNAARASWWRYLHNAKTLCHYVHSSLQFHPMQVTVSSSAEFTGVHSRAAHFTSFGICEPAR